MWHEFLDKNKFIISLYDEVPLLKDVRISGINIHDEGRIVAVSFDMPYFAERPPKKWLELGDNTVFVRIDFSALQEMSISSGQNDFRGDIEIFKDELEQIVLKITGTVNALIKAESGFIQSVSGYCS